MAALPSAVAALDALRGVPTATRNGLQFLSFLSALKANRVRTRAHVRV